MVQNLSTFHNIILLCILIHDLKLQSQIDSYKCVAICWLTLFVFIVGGSSFRDVELDRKYPVFGDRRNFGAQRGLMRWNTVVSFVTKL